MFSFINYKNRNMIAVLIVLSIFVSLFLFINYSTKINEQMKNRDLYIINDLVEKNPEMETEIISTFKNALNSENTKIVNRYLVSQEYDFQYGELTNTTNKSISFLIFFMTIIGVFIYMYQNKVFKDVEQKLYKLIHNIDKAMNLDFKNLDEKNEEGAIYLLYTQFNLLSRRYKSLIQKMEENHIYLKDLIYNLSHQLKTPISSIKIFNEIMISEEDFKENQTKEFLLKSKKQINKMEWIIKKMFEISKIENNEISFKKEKVNLVSIIEEIKESYKHLIEEKQLLVVVDKKDDPEILIDKNMVKEAISNVIENAFKYSFPKEKVIIKLSEKNEKIFLSVKDKGIKIEEYQEILFNKFYRSSEAKKTNPEGTGLGLAFTKAIIEKNNGEIQVFSEDENTEFIIKFQK